MSQRSSVGRIVVLASGGGTNCQALIDAIDSGRLNAEIVAVITNRAEAGVIARAESAGITCQVVDHIGREPSERREADDRLIAAIATYEPDLVVLAGWMRILGAEVGAAFPIINLHPALPGEFAGVNAISRAFDAWQAGEITESGVMVHWVPDDGVDVGPVVRSEVVAFEPGDSLDDFEARLHLTEHRLIVDATAEALEGLLAGIPHTGHPVPQME